MALPLSGGSLDEPPGCYSVGSIFRADCHAHFFWRDTPGSGERFLHNWMIQTQQLQPLRGSGLVTIIGNALYDRAAGVANLKETLSKRLQAKAAVL